VHIAVHIAACAAVVLQRPCCRAVPLSQRRFRPDTRAMTLMPLRFRSLPCPLSRRVPRDRPPAVDDAPDRPRGPARRRPMLCAAVALVMGSGLAGPGGAGTAHAARPVGGPAPDIALEAAHDGQLRPWTLAEALRQGPVVLFFFPAAFSVGCSIEARQFAEAMPEFKALGASVVGISTDDAATLQRFSAAECQGRFPVLSDTALKATRAYDVEMDLRPGYASRSSFVIAPRAPGAAQGTIVFRLDSLNPHRHVHAALQALRRWRGEPAADAAARPPASPAPAAAATLRPLTPRP
jgi:peroxiredoxin